MARSARHLRYRYGVDLRGDTAWVRGERSMVGMDQQTLRAIAMGVTPPAPPASTGMTFASILPATGVINSPDITCVCTGTGFDTATRVVWDGAEVTTYYISPTQVSFLIRPKGETARVVNVQVRRANSAVVGSIRTFTFTATVLDDPEVLDKGDKGDPAPKGAHKRGGD